MTWPPWYDRDGSAISVSRANELLGDAAYRHIAGEQVGAYWVSTVWLGLDHSLGRGVSPVIFETVVFAPDGEQLGPDLECRRYSTEAAARAGHAELVTLLRATVLADPEDLL